jgi:hypothetical protein
MDVEPDGGIYEWDGSEWGKISALPVTLTTDEFALLARAWAANPEDEEVNDGLFSALHYAAKAQASAELADSEGNATIALEAADRAEDAETGAVTAQGLAETAADRAETAEAGALAAAGSQGYFADAAAGIAGTTDGQAFWTIEGGNRVDYLNDDGTAEPLVETPNAELARQGQRSPELARALDAQPLLGETVLLADFERGAYAKRAAIAPNLRPIAEADALSVTRNSLGGRIGPDGKFEWGIPVNTPRITHELATGKRKGVVSTRDRTQQLLHNADLTNEYWDTQTNLTPVAFADPDVGEVFALMEGDSETAVPHVFGRTEAYRSGSGFHIHYAFVKAGLRTRVKMYKSENFDNTGAGSGNNAVTVFDLETKEIITTTNSGGGIIELPGGWFMCWHRINRSNAHYYIAPMVGDSNEYIPGDDAALYVAYPSIASVADTAQGVPYLEPAVTGASNFFIAQDAISIGVADWLRARRGTIWLRGEMSYRTLYGDMNLLTIGDTSGDDYLRVWIDTGGGNQANDGRARLTVTVVDDGAEWEFASERSVFDTGLDALTNTRTEVPFSVALTWDAAGDDFRVSINGGLIETAVDAPTIPASILSEPAIIASGEFVGVFQQVAAWPYALDDAKLRAVSAGEPVQVIAEDAPGAEDFAVTTSFVEPASDDPSRDLFVTWIADSEDARVLEYRPRGASVWVPVSSGRTRAVPELSGLWLHTAAIMGQAPDTLIDFRVVGSSHQDTTKTARRFNALEVLTISDWQTTDYTSGGALHKFGNIITNSARQPDIAYFNGDINDDDGRFTAAWASDWVSIFTKLSETYRTRGGALIPWVFIVGNHEGRNAAGTSNAHAGGDGTLGMIKDFCSWSYHPLHEKGRFHDSAGRIKIGSMYMALTMDTDHTNPIAGQVDWIGEELDANAGDVKHLFALGHNPPFNTYPLSGNINNAPRYQDAGNRVMRNLIWPLFQAYSGPGLPMRSWDSGHSHAVVVSRKLLMQYDDQASDAVNDANFETDTVNGFQNIGFGQLADPAQFAPSMATLESNIDSEVWWLGIMHRDPDDIDTVVTLGSIFDNQKARSRNVLYHTLTDDSWKLEIINEDGDLFYEQVESDL